MSIYGYNHFINEIKTYQLYKGVTSDTMKLILIDNKIKNNGDFNTQLRKNVIGRMNAISCSRNFNMAKHYGDFIFEFNMIRLSSVFKITPFCENPDYYIKRKNDEKSKNNKNSLDFNKNKSCVRQHWTYKELRNKKYGKDYWNVKTDMTNTDFDICEELIVTDEIDITKYVSKIYYTKIYSDLDLIESVKDLCNKYNIELIEL